MSVARAALRSKPVVRRRLHESVVRQIAARILSGELPTGAVLPTESELARDFAVSRITIREAVRVLAAKGLVVVKHGSGMHVQDPAYWDQFDPLVLFERVRAGHDEAILHELVELRRTVEVEAAGLAALRRTAQELEALARILHEMHAALDDHDAYFVQDTAFHEAILAAARNRLLRYALRPVSQTLSIGRLLTIRRSALPMDEGYRSHEQIYLAIESGDGDRARAAMRQHVMHFEEDVSAGLRKGITDVLDSLLWTDELTDTLGDMLASR